MHDSPLPQIHPFSAGYYMVDGVTIDVIDDIETPRIQDHVYAYIQDAYYGTRQTPILYKHMSESQHFEVQPIADVGIDTVQLPTEYMTMMETEVIRDTSTLLLAKPGRAEQIYDLHEQLLTTTQYNDTL